VCFNLTYGVNLAQAAGKVHVYQLNWKRKGLSAEKKNFKKVRWTYRLYPKRLPASIETIIDCPCLLCPDNARCDPTTAISPKSCPKLTDWIDLGKEPQTVQAPASDQAIANIENIEEDDGSDAESLDSVNEKTKYYYKKAKAEKLPLQSHLQACSG